MSLIGSSDGDTTRRGEFSSHLDGMAREKEGGGIAYGSAKGLFVAGLTPHSVLRKFPTAKCASTKAVDISLRTW